MKTEVIYRNGAGRLVINDQELDPVSYRAFWPQAQTVRNFADKGFQLFSIFPTGVLCSLKVPYSQFGEVWIGEGQYNWDNLRAQVDMFIQNAPDARFSLMVQLDTRDWFLQANPGCTDSFANLAMTAGWQKWRHAAARYLRALLDTMDKEYPEKVFAVYLFAGGTCEWFSRYPDASAQDHKPINQVYRHWLGEAAEIPDAAVLKHTTQGCFRSPVQDAQAIQYWRFHSEVVADTIAWFALQVKEHTHGALLTGVFYGYLLEMQSSLQLASSHNAYTKVLADRNIDLIFAPASYAWRRLDSTSSFQLPVDSIRLHQKLYIHEIDNTTWLVNDNQYAQVLQNNYHKRLETLEQTVMYSRREVALAMIHGAGYWWFDMFAGWYDDDRLMDELAKLRQASQTLWRGDLRSASEIAVFIDQESNYYVGDACCINTNLIRQQIEELGRMGLPWDCYVADDLCHPELPDDQYKLYIFPNLFKPSEAIRQKISKLRQAGKSVLFMHAPGFLTDEGFSTSAMLELTGMPIVENDQPADRLIRTDLTDQILEYGFSDPVAPLFTLSAQEDPACEIIGRYTASGLPALAMHWRGDAFDAWSGGGSMPGPLLKELARRAGAFVYSETADPIYVNRSIFGLFAHQAGTRTVCFPEAVVLENLFDPEDSIATEKQMIQLVCADDEMRLYQIKKYSESV